MDLDSGKLSAPEQLVSQPITTRCGRIAVCHEESSKEGKQSTNDKVFINVRWTVSSDFVNLGVSDSLSGVGLIAFSALSESCSPFTL